MPLSASPKRSRVSAGRGCAHSESTRATVRVTSCVCSVDSTRWPVSEARRAMSMVSSSRISPTRMTSGSWRSAARRALRERGRVLADLALGHRRERVGVDELDRVLDGDDVPARVAVHLADHRRQRRRLAVARGAHHQHEPAVELGEAAHGGRRAELVEARNVERDRAHRERERLALAEEVDAVAADALHRVRAVVLLQIGDGALIARLREHDLASRWVCAGLSLSACM